MRTIQEAILLADKELHRSMNKLNKYASLMLHAKSISSQHETAYKTEYSNYSKLLEISRDLSLQVYDAANHILDKKDPIPPLTDKNKLESTPSIKPLPIQNKHVDLPYLESLLPKPVYVHPPRQTSTNTNTIADIIRTLFKFNDLKQCKSSNTSAAYYMSVKDIRTAISKNDLLKMNIPKYSGMKKEDICKRLMELKSST